MNLTVTKRKKKIHQFILSPFLQFKWVENEIPKLVTDREETLELHSVDEFNTFFSLTLLLVGT